jgi:hypothetical protein
MGPTLRDEARRVWTTLPKAMPAAPALARFLADWPAAPSQPSREGIRARRAAPPPASHPAAGRMLAVLRWLPQLAVDAGRFGADFIETLGAAAGSLDWRQTYSVAEVGGEFLRNYAWAELSRPGVGIGAAQISCGVLVLGPNTFYPPHRHEAEEIYLPLAGTAEWLRGDGVWRHRRPGTLIHHSSEETHAMRTGEQPLLAMYLWRSADLGQSARLDPRSAE